MSYNIKQVIVFRRKYPDGKGGFSQLRTGKIAAQVAHASMMFISHMLGNGFNLTENDCEPEIAKERKAWFKGSFAKICLYVDSEEELDRIYKEAEEAGLTVHMVIDSGATEFHGVPTKTCLAIGPHDAEKIDKITGDLKLL